MTIFWMTFFIPSYRYYWGLYTLCLHHTVNIRHLTHRNVFKLYNSILICNWFYGRPGNRVISYHADATDVHTAQQDECNKAGKLQRARIAIKSSFTVASGALLAWFNLMCLMHNRLWHKHWHADAWMERCVRHQYWSKVQKHLKKAFSHF